jgi:hypothetical protein
MKNIKTFESFDSSGMTQSITLTVSSENPDAKWDFEVTGVGNTKKEAAIFALGIGWGVTSDSVEGHTEVIGFEEAMEYLEEYDSSWEDSVDSLVSTGTLPKDYFADHGTDSECSVDFGTSMMEPGGYIIDSEFENFY